MQRRSMLSLFLLLALVIGCSGQVGMFGVPAGCARASCTVYAQWTLVSNDTLEFELEGTTEGWVAIGVSADQVMGTDGIDDVFVCQRDATNDIVYAEDTYNPVSPRGNRRDSDQAGFQLIDSSFTNGRISCSFNRSVSADNLTEDRNLNETAFLLLAFGDRRGGPNVTISVHNRNSRQASAAQVVLTDGVSPAPVGMFGVPAGCTRASCTVYAQWTLTSVDTLEFELEGTTMGWVAIGVSADQVMGTDGIDDVFVCQRDAMNDIVYAEDTYNPVSPRGNRRDSDQAGFQLIDSSFTNGRIFCSFNRSVNADNLTEDRNLNERAFLLLAFGDRRGGPNVAISAHNQASRQASAAQVVLTDAFSPAPVGMFGDPAGCTRASCDVYAQWTLTSVDTLEFELEGTTMGWVAIGVSADQVMGTDGIDDVFVCQRDAMNDIVYAEDTYNPVSPRGNRRDSDQTGFQLIDSSFTNGRIFCSFNRSVSADNLTEDRNLNERAFLLLAFGDRRGGPNVTISAHNQTSRQASAAQVVLTDGVSPAPPTTGPVGTFTFPSGCSRSACAIYAQWIQLSDDTFEFQLEGAAEGWVAVGVSADQRMGVNGIDDVFACQRSTTGDIVYAEDTYNPQDQSTRGNRRDSDQTGFQLMSSSFTNGRISCTFTRSTMRANVAEDRNLNELAFVLIASGPQRGGPNIALGLHGVRQATDALVDLTEGGNQAAGCSASPLIRVHGILMYIAWVWLVPTAYFFAANMKPAMPTGVWFQVHRALMLIAIAPSVLGFILIFVAFRDSGNPNGLIVLGAQNPIGTTHYVFGIVIIMLQFINPIISFCRGKPDGKFRWIFNLIHGNLIGWGVILLALLNVSLGLWQYSTLAYGQLDNSRYYPFWVWIVFLIVYTFWDSFLFVYSKWIGPRLNKMWKKKEKEFEMRPTNTDPKDKEDPPKKKPSKDAPLRYGFMIFNTALLLLPGLVIMLLIAIGCI